MAKRSVRNLVIDYLGTRIRTIHTYVSPLVLICNVQGGFIKNAYDKTISLPIDISKGLTVVGTHYGESYPTNNFMATIGFKSNSQIYGTFTIQQTTAWMSYIAFGVA